MPGLNAGPAQHKLKAQARFSIKPDKAWYPKTPQFFIIKKALWIWAWKSSIYTKPDPDPSPEPKARALPKPVPDLNKGVKKFVFQVSGAGDLRPGEVRAAAGLEGDVGSQGQKEQNHQLWTRSSGEKGQND